MEVAVDNAEGVGLSAGPQLFTLSPPMRRDSPARLAPNSITRKNTAEYLLKTSASKA